MVTPDPKRRKEARAKIRAIIDNPETWSVIHYSCESFSDRPHGQSPRITSIAVQYFSSEQVDSFSIHLVAERAGVDPQCIKQQYDDLELSMLKEFFAHLKNRQDRRYLHWNMRDVGYGFKAIEHRFLKLGGNQDDLYIIEDSKKADLARLLKDIYGDGYVGHPRMERVFAMNGTPRNYLTGAEEASAFEAGEYFKLHQSTLGKVHAFADIARLAYEGKLKTNATWWDLHGGGVRVFADLVITHPRWAAASGLIGIVGIAITVLISR